MQCWKQHTFDLLMPDIHLSKDLAILRWNWGLFPLPWWHWTSKGKKKLCPCTNFFKPSQTDATDDGCKSSFIFLFSVWPFEGRKNNLAANLHKTGMAQLRKTVKHWSGEWPIISLSNKEESNPKKKFRTCIWPATQLQLYSEYAALCCQIHCIHSV